MLCGDGDGELLEHQDDARLRDPITDIVRNLTWRAHGSDVFELKAQLWQAHAPLGQLRLPQGIAVVVPAHARVLFASRPPGSIRYLDADLRDTGRLLDQAEAGGQPPRAAGGSRGVLVAEVSPSRDLG